VSASRPERVRVGTAGRAHGLDGTVAVEGACGWFPFATGSHVLVAGTRRRIRRRGGTDARPLVAFEGVADRTAAEELRGAPLELAGDDVPAPEEGAYFRFDLVGCEVLQGGARLGAVAAVEDGVAHDVLLLDSGLRLPFVEAVVPVVDLAARRIEIDPALIVDQDATEHG
jgi:16S rRNA processing protein RimM